MILATPTAGSNRPVSNRPVSDRPVIEWPTFLLICATYALWALATTWLYSLSPVAGILLAGLAIAQFSSLQHEVLHGHPFRSRWLNEALVFAGLTLTVPYARFRDTHLAHHHDPVLTDPYDDPESNYLAPAVWAALPVPVRLLLRANNTLLGRIVLGPLIGTVMWLWGEGRLMLAGNHAVIRAWLTHAGGVILVLVWLGLAAMPVWAYLLAAWIGHGLLKIRTFLEHRAHDAPRARTVIVEDRGPLALLFLNNNFHSVHHMHPTAPWYRLPALYAAQRGHYLRRNEGYVYRSYAQVFVRHLLRAKDPVPHPLHPAPPGAIVPKTALRPQKV